MRSTEHRPQTYVLLLVLAVLPCTIDLPVGTYNYELRDEYCSNDQLNSNYLVLEVWFRVLQIFLLYCRVCIFKNRPANKMGNLCECMKLQPETSRESTPLIFHEDVELRSTTGEAERGAKFYQSVIDEAHKNFISSSSRRRMGMGSGSEELRSKVTNATVDASSWNSVGLKPTTSTGNSSRVIDFLSEPVDISAIDAVADEIAELVSSHTFNFRQFDDKFSSTVVSFKPVVGTLSS